MSLAQHVTSLEGVDRQEVDAEEEPIRRVLSYDAAPPPIARQEAVTDASAYKVSTAKRLAQVMVTLLSCWLASGIVYGFAALKPVLIEEGVYSDLCEEGEVSIYQAACSKQDLHFNLVFTIASITANVSALPVGTILDRYGLRVCTIAGCIFLTAGGLLMSFASSISKIDGYNLGYFCLALGGTFIFVPSYQIANAFPRFNGTVVALVTGAFDASAAVFLFYRLVYEATDGAFSPDRFFLVYLVVPAFIFIAQLSLMPAHGYQTMPQLEKKLEKAHDVTRDVHDSDDEIESNSERRRVRDKRRMKRRDKIRRIDEVMGDAEERQQKAERQEDVQITSGVWGALHGQPARKQMISPWFILITLLTVLQMLRMNYFIATVRAQYRYMLGSPSRALRINNFFDVALPVGGVTSTPFIGLLLDNLSMPSMLAVLVACITLIGILNSLPFYWAGYATVILFVLLRPLYYSTMSDYAAKVFGFATFGRVYGTIICLSGLFNFFQYAIDSLTHGPLHGDPTPVNVAMTVGGFVVGVALVGFVYVKGKQLRRRQLEEDAEEEREFLIPELDEDVDHRWSDRV